MGSSNDLRAIILACLLGMAVVRLSNAGCCCESSSSSSSPKFFMSYSSPPMIPPPPPVPAPGYYGGVPPVDPTMMGGPVLAPVPGAGYPPPPPMFSPPAISPYGPPPQYYAGAYGAPLGGGTTFTTYGSLGSSCFWMFGRKKRGTRSDENEDALLFTPVKANDRRTVIGNGAVSTIDGRILIGNGNFYANRTSNLLEDPGSSPKPQLTILGETTSASTRMQHLTTHNRKPSTTTTSLSGPDYGYANISGQSININKVSNLAAAPPNGTADWRRNGWKWIAMNGGPTTAGETQLTQTLNSTASSSTVIDLRDIHIKDTQRLMWNARERRRVKRQCCGGCGCCGGGGGGSMAANMTNSNMGTGGCGCECECGCGCGCCCSGNGMINPQMMSTQMVTTTAPTMTTTSPMMTTTAPTMTTTTLMMGGTNSTG